MSDGEKSGDFGGEENGQSVIAVPADQVQTVLDFIAALESEEGDVTGHMINLGGLSPLGGGALSVKKRTTGSGCVWDPLQKKFVCGDLD
ncbi:MAG: hypothetical protein WBW04_21110 [Nitrolancea sp.]